MEFKEEIKMQKEKPKIIVFASGAKDGGGTGFKNLVVKSRENNSEINYEIVAVVSNYENGGVKKIADELGIKFIYFKKPFSAEKYIEIVKNSGADWVALSGWLKLTKGLDSKTTFNIHPGKLPEFGGDGMYGIYVHRAIIEAGARWTAVTMHFVTDIYDDGPIFFQFPINVKKDDTPESLGKRVNLYEHKFQPLITSMVVNGEISWDGKDANTLKIPKEYNWL